MGAEVYTVARWLRLYEFALSTSGHLHHLRSDRILSSLRLIPDPNVPGLWQQQRADDEGDGRHNDRIIQPGVDIACSRHQRKTYRALLDECIAARKPARRRSRTCSANSMGQADSQPARPWMPANCQPRERHEGRRPRAPATMAARILRR